VAATKGRAELIPGGWVDFYFISGEHMDLYFAMIKWLGIYKGWVVFIAIYFHKLAKQQKRTKTKQIIWLWKPGKRRLSTST
jgi:hypothetical protein